MDDMNYLYELTTREQLRDWLSANHTTEKVCWIPVSMKPTPGNHFISRRRGGSTLFRLDRQHQEKTSGRKAMAEVVSSCTPVTVDGNSIRKGCAGLKKLGLMTPAGRACLPQMDTEAFEIDPIIMESLRSDEQTYKNFLSLPPLYVRVRIDNIGRVTENVELFEKRLKKFIESTCDNIIYGDWHDNGRLLDY